MSRSHGLSNKKIYGIYNNMTRRVLEEHNKRYKDYGGRGIKICAEWLGKGGFINFYNWATNNGYEEGLSLERNDVDGNYEPSNCKWITIEEQARNKRNTVWINIEGERRPLQEWAEISGVHSGTIWFRLQNGYTGRDLIKDASPVSGERWIYWDNRKKRWRVRIPIDGTKKSFGTFGTLGDAIQKRDEVIKGDETEQTPSLTSDSCNCSVEKRYNVIR